MSQDRWAHEFKLDSPKHSSPKATTAGIAPTSFHKKKRTANELSCTEKHLGELLQLASKNEVVQKRKDFTTGQNVRLEAYESVTSFRIFPLQDLAMGFLDEMMKDYLGSNQVEENKKEQDSSSAFTKKQKLCYEQEILQLRDECIKSYMNEMKYNPLSSPPAIDFEFLAPLWSMEPRIFALETSSSGKRKYIVSNLGRFMNHYWRKSDPKNRHYYELIREDTPCRLYFDLEYCKLSNDKITAGESETFMTEFIDELCSQFVQTYNITLTRECIVDLDSSTDKKFSRHLIVHLPHDELFKDAHAAGVFAKQFVSRLADELAAGTLEKRQPILAQCLFVKTKDPTKTTCFVDLGVYTKNRLFRILGSSKFGKRPDAALRIASANKFRFPDEFDNSNFYMVESAPISQSISDHDQFCRSLQWEKHAAALALTLVVPVNASKMQYPILKSSESSENADKSSSSVPRPTSSCSIIANRPITSSMKSNGQSPIPKLDEYILSTVGRRGGSQGRIRAWSIECRDNVYYLTYQMCENRWCERIGRQHKSNNIMWTVDLKHKACWQSCHDSECQGFRGSIISLSSLDNDSVAEIDEFLFDRELEHLDVTQVATATIEHPAADVDFNDEVMDKALGELDLPPIVSPNVKGCVAGQPSSVEEFDDSELDRALRDIDMSSIVSPPAK